MRFALFFPPLALGLLAGCGPYNYASRSPYPVSSQGANALSSGATLQDSGTRPSSATLSMERATLAEQQADDQAARVAEAQNEVLRLNQDLVQAQANLTAEERAAQQARLRAEQAYCQTGAPAPSGQAPAASRTTLATPPAPQVSGTVVWATPYGVGLRAAGNQPVTLRVTPQTRVLLDGQVSSSIDLPQGAQVRARYDVLPDGATAIRLDATEASAVTP